MASKRNRLIDIVSYLQSLGIEVNIAKTKARGNKGFFRVKGNSYRIDIAKGHNDDEIISLLTHEFSHYVHYSYDKTLKSLSFVFEKENQFLEELIQITVETIPKSSVEPLFNAKKELEEKLKSSNNPFIKITTQKMLNRINSKIYRLNRYYNSPTELFARSFETYITNKDLLRSKAPKLTEYYDNLVGSKKIQLLTDFVEVLNNSKS